MPSSLCDELVFGPPVGCSVKLECIYVSSPVDLWLSVEVKDCRVTDWWIEELSARESSLSGEKQSDEPRRHTMHERVVVELWGPLDSSVQTGGA